MLTRGAACLAGLVVHSEEAGRDNSGPAPDGILLAQAWNRSIIPGDEPV